MSKSTSFGGDDDVMTAGRWDDENREVAGAMWNRAAQDRPDWIRLEEAFVNWQTD